MFIKFKKKPNTMVKSNTMVTKAILMPQWLSGCGQPGTKRAGAPQF
jgi:hypothetical protein